MNFTKFLMAALVATPLIFANGTVLAEAAADADLKKQVASILESFGIKDADTTINDIGVDGLREVIVGGDVFYLTADGKHLLIGNMLAVQEDSMINLTEKTKGKLRVETLSALSDDEMIIFGDDDSKHALIVFTDVNCVFCARFHKKIDDFNAAGVRVKYIFMPVIKPTSLADAKSVWCSEDRNKALTDAKEGKKLPAAECETPIEKHLEIGRKLGINATPTIFLTDGSKFNGNWMQMDGKMLATFLDAQAK